MGLTGMRMFRSMSCLIQATRQVGAVVAGVSQVVARQVRAVVSVVSIVAGVSQRSNTS